ncbi:MAG: M48 family metalloprotease [Calditrichia bacterium]
MNTPLITKWFRNIALGISFLWILACAVNPVTGKREFMLLSEADEIAMGAQSDPQIVQMYGVHENPRIENFITTVGNDMVAVSHRSNIKFDFKLMDTPVINAFAVPGGYVYITRGIMAYLNSDAEFAGVMGHEIGHVTARHSAKSYSRSQVAQLGLGLGSVLSQTFAQFAGLASQGMQLLFLKNGRDAERESDQLGVEYSTKVGYDAREMANFFNTLNRMRPADGGGLPDFLSTHPNPAERVGNIQKLAAEWQSRVPNSNLKIGRNDFLNRLEGLVYGDDPQQGYVADNMFFHPTLKFQFPIPGGWKHMNTPSAVQMQNEAGDAAMIMQLGKGTPAAAANTFLTESQATVESQGATTVNGLNAYRTVATLNTQNGALKILSYFITYGSNTYVFHGYTSAQAFGQQASTFESTMKGFRKLTDTARMNVKPDRIRIKRITRSTPLKAALKTHGTPDDKLDELALINGMQLTDVLAPNTLIKTIGK